MKTKIVLRKKQLKSTGLYPVVLRLSEKNTTSYIKLAVDIPLEDWDGDQVKRSNKQYRDLNKEIWRAEELIGQITTNMNLDLLTTAKCFKEQFFGLRQTLLARKVVPFWTDRIMELKSMSKFGNAKTYKDCLTKFRSFTTAKKLDPTFEEVTQPLVMDYITFLLQNGCNSGGASVYVRTFRAVYNHARKKEVFVMTKNPFHEVGVGKLRSKKQKKALTIQQFLELKKTKNGLSPMENTARLIFLCMVGLGGVNFADLAKMKWSDLENGKISYYRSKTGKPFVVSVFPWVLDIIYSMRETYPNGELMFPIVDSLKCNLNSEEFFKHRKEALRRFNKRLKKVAILYDLPKDLGSYHARHTFANILRVEKVETEMISKVLGHSDVKVTQGYLNSITNEEVDDCLRRLDVFKEGGFKYQIAS